MFEHDALDVLSDMNPEYEAIIYHVPMLMGVDFSELLEDRLDYAEQPHIQNRRVWLMAACAVYYNLDFGLVLRCFSGEYLAEWRDVAAILDAVDGHISSSNKNRTEHILTKGCPANLIWEEDAKNKEAFIRRENNPSIQAN